MKKLRKFIPLIIMGCIAATAVVLVLTRGNVTVQTLLDYTPKNKLLAALILLVVYAVKSQTVVVPYVVIAAAAGLLFELPAALLINSLGAVIIISIPYFIGRSSGGAPTDALMRKSARVRRIYEDNRQNTFMVSLVLRALSVSNDIMGVFFGSLGVSYSEYLISSFIGIIPVMVLATVVGSDPDPLSAPVLVCAAVELLSILTAWYLLRRKKRAKKEPENEK